MGVVVVVVVVVDDVVALTTRTCFFFTFTRDPFDVDVGGVEEDILFQL
jgi:hypothetical protein